MFIKSVGTLSPTMHKPDCWKPRDGRASGTSEGNIPLEHTRIDFFALNGSKAIRYNQYWCPSCGSCFNQEIWNVELLGSWSITVARLSMLSMYKFRSLFGWFLIASLLLVQMETYIGSEVDEKCILERSEIPLLTYIDICISSLLQRIPKAPSSHAFECGAYSIALRVGSMVEIERKDILRSLWLAFCWKQIGAGE